MSLGAKKLTTKPAGPAKGVLAKAVLAKTAKPAAKTTAKPASKIETLAKPVAALAKATSNGAHMNGNGNGSAAKKQLALTASTKPVASRAALVNKPARATSPRPLNALPKPVAKVEPVTVDPRWQMFYDLLCAKKAELSGSLSDTRYGTQGQNGRVAEEDQATVSHEEFISSKRNAMDFKMLRLVQAALDRIVHGEYGICHACEEDISEKRLKAIPWAAFCVHCQDNHAHDDDDQGEPITTGAAPALQVWNW